MNFKLSRKNAEQKWWTYGSFKKNQWDNYQASFKISNLEEAIDLAKQKGDEWINFSAFEDDKQESPQQVSNEPSYPQDDDSQSMPF